jgi:hypothetical protein
MKNLLDTILEANGGAIVSQLSREFGLRDSQTRDALGQLAPWLARGIQRNARTSAGLDSLAKAVREGSHAHYLERPEELARKTTAADGNSILGHIFGNKDVSRNVAGRAARETGIDSSLLKQMLPVVAALAMGALSKGGRSDELLGGQQASSGSSGAELLTRFLDSDRDGSVIDDVLGLAQKFF